MALIECKNCGKKISDTVDVCIHCHTPTKKVENCSHVNETVDNTSNEKPKFIKFEEYSSSDQKYLEKEFLKNDKWARAYRSRRYHVPKFFSTGLGGISGIITIILLVRVFIDELGSSAVINPQYEDYAIKAVVAILGISILLIFYSIIGKIFHKKSNELLYAKRFQLWLLEKKNVEYTPKFAREAQKMEFEQLKLK